MDNPIGHHGWIILNKIGLSTFNGYVSATKQSEKKRSTLKIKDAHPDSYEYEFMK